MSDVLLPIRWPPRTGVLPFAALAILCAGACDAKKAPVAQAQVPTPTPQYESFNVFVNNKTLGPTHGCSVVSSGGHLEHGGPLICGVANATSRVEWDFRKATADGDVYEMSRTTPADSMSQTENAPTSGLTRDVKVVTFVYNAKPLVVFEDDAQIVIVYPKATTLPTNMDTIPRL